MIILSLDDTEMRGPIKGLADRLLFDKGTSIEEKEAKIREAFESTIKCWKDNLEGKSQFVKDYEEG